MGSSIGLQIPTDRIGIKNDTAFISGSPGVCGHGTGAQEHPVAFKQYALFRHLHVNDVKNIAISKLGQANAQIAQAKCLFGKSGVQFAEQPNAFGIFQEQTCYRWIILIGDPAVLEERTYLKMCEYIHGFPPFVIKKWPSPLFTLVHIMYFL